jgi:hypothetical protein
VRVECNKPQTIKKEKQKNRQGRAELPAGSFVKTKRANPINAD